MGGGAATVKHRSPAARAAHGRGAAAVEAIVLAGDLLGCPDGFATPEDAQRHDARGLVSLLETAGHPVFYVMGNDDLVELEPPRGSPVRSVHGRRACAGGFAFVGYQYSLPFMGGPFEKPEAGIAADLEPLAALLDPRTVVVSHSPALGVLDPGVGDVRIGSAALGALLARRPFRAHVHGHSHGGFGREGAHFNVASAARRRAMLVDLETLEHRVVRSA